MALKPLVPTQLGASERLHPWPPTYQLLLHLLLLTQLQVGRDLESDTQVRKACEAGPAHPLQLATEGELGEGEGHPLLTIMASSTVRCGRSMSSCMM